jgi:hypothetical protein
MVFQRAAPLGSKESGPGPLRGQGAVKQPLPRLDMLMASAAGYNPLITRQENPTSRNVILPSKDVSNSVFWGQRLRIRHFLLREHHVRVMRDGSVGSVVRITR